MQDDGAPQDGRRDGLLTASLEIVNVKGLHARASAKFAATAERYEADVTVSKDSMTVNATSIMGLLMLAAAQGSVIELAAIGEDAAEALAALGDLVSGRFDEGE